MADCVAPGEAPTGPADFGPPTPRRPLYTSTTLIPLHLARPILLSFTCRTKRLSFIPLPLPHPSKNFKKLATLTTLPHTPTTPATDTTYMALKSPQNIPNQPAEVTTAFDDDLVYRCFPHKFRMIGDPSGYLSAVGIQPMLEFIYKGHLLIDVASATNVPLTALRRWVEDNQYGPQVEEAETQSAEGYLARAHNHIRNAKTEFELRRGRELMKHAEFMAEKKNKPIYGEGVQKGTGNVVNYKFVIGALPPAAIPPVIEGIVNRLPMDGAGYMEDSAPAHLQFDYLHSQQPIGQMDFGLTPADPRLEPVVLPSEPTLVQGRPVRPTFTQPDVGPFYADPTDVENTELPDFYEVRT